jgi:hypothetical protein
MMVTPGPFVVDRHDDADRGTRVLIVTKDQAIAIAAMWEENVDSLDALMPDAYLLAKAPEMRRALEIIASTTHHINLDGKGTHSKSCPPCLAAAALPEIPA